MTDPRYPIGRFEAPGTFTSQQRVALIEEIAAAPAQMRRATSGLSPEQLDTPYREGGWTVRQVVHHVPDSHLNAYVRFKLALTEEAPTIKPYDEALWADLPDSRGEIAVSLALLTALHARWVTLLRAFDEAGFGRVYRHPELGTVSLDRALALYAWHGRHHVAHITGLRERMGW